MSNNDTSSAAVTRAKSYFLVNAIVGNSLTFALGPKLLDGEESPEEEEQNRKPADDNEPRNGVIQDAEQGNLQTNGQADENADNTEATEQTSLLPESVVRRGEEARRTGYRQGKKEWNRLPKWVQKFLDFSYAFLNAPLIGAVIGAVIGLTPILHRWFFSEPQQGGIFTAWLTSSVKSIGELFAALQTVVVGVKLSGSLRKMKRGEDSGTVPWIPTTYILVIRFLVWPAVSIGTIYLLSVRTNWLPSDPMLWFTMMLMPTGPPAMKLTALADVNGSNEQEKMSIAKFLTVSYAVSPLICIAVVGSLKASQAAMG